MVQRHAAQRPKGVLQAFGKGDKALPAQHYMRVLKAREREAEVIKPMPQGLAFDRDGKLARVGEVRQAKPARLVALTEDDVLLWAFHRAPKAHAPFQRAPGVGV